jgi:hypothetical protein
LGDGEILVDIPAVRRLGGPAGPDGSVRQGRGIVASRCIARSRRIVHVPYTLRTARCSRGAARARPAASRVGDRPDDPAGRGFSRRRRVAGIAGAAKPDAPRAQPRRPDIAADAARRRRRQDCGAAPIGIVGGAHAGARRRRACGGRRQAATARACPAPQRAIDPADGAETAM